MPFHRDGATRSAYRREHNTPATLTWLLPLWTLLSSVLVCYAPTTFTLIGSWIIVLLMPTMFGMGVHLKLEDSKRVLPYPALIAAEISLHYLVMPLVA